MKKTLQKICEKAVIQGNHKERIIAYYVELVRAARKEFYEDNKPTLDAFLTECFQESLKEA
ncbi:hypothetical protein LCGC14_1587660 [marine sediment metagenome]|uniref:Uncharacterized protein n=1 Tax=marine sediment metagenome TaxID=412755 RepID=A0A0F9IFA8_9ZZZZ